MKTETTLEVIVNRFWRIFLILLIFLLLSDGKSVTPVTAQVNSVPPVFQVPVPLGETWGYTRTHSQFWGENRYGTTSAIDLYYETPFPDYGTQDTSNRWVVAAEDGTVEDANLCSVLIDHGNGWKTYYLHLENIQVNNGDAVHRNQRIGNFAETLAQATSCDDASATHVHVHFSIIHNNIPQSINNHWTWALNGTYNDVQNIYPIIPPLENNLIWTSFSDDNGYQHEPYDWVATAGETSLEVIQESGNRNALLREGSMYYDVWYQMPANSLFKLSFKLRNRSAQAARLNFWMENRDLREQNPNLQDGYVVNASVEVPSGDSLRLYELWGILNVGNQNTRQLRVEFNNVDNRELIFDDISLEYLGDTVTTLDNDSRARIEQHYLCGPTTSPAQEIMPFCDVNLDNIFRENIINVASRDITNGYSDGTFGSDNPITRGEMAKMIARGMGLKVKEGTTFSNQFTDVPSTNPYYGFIHGLRLFGVVDGFSDGSFRPVEKVTREQMAKFIALARAKLVRDPQYCINFTPSKPFLDVPKSNPFYSYIHCLAETPSRGGKPIISGYDEDGTFRPGENVTRGQSAKFIDYGLIFPTEDPANAITSSTCDEYDKLLDKTYLVKYGNDICVLSLDQASDNTQAVLASAQQATAGKTYEAIAYNLGPNVDLVLDVQAPSGQTIVSKQRLGAETEIRTQWTASTSGEYRIYLRNLRQFAEEGTRANFHIHEVQDYDFADVPTGDIFYPAIKALHEAGLVNGCGVENNQPIFCPTQKMEREDVMMVLARWLYQYAPGESHLLPPATGIFPDLTGNGEGERAVELAYRDGIVGGFDDGQFKPNDFMTREHAMVVIMRALLRHAAPDPGSFAFQENTQEHTRMGGRLGITTVAAGQPFRPNEKITRAEAASFLCNALLGQARCSNNQQSDSTELRRLREKAVIARMQNSICFTAASSAGHYIPGVDVTQDGTPVCYPLPTGPYQAQDVSKNFTYRVDSQEYPACLEGGIIGLRLAPDAGNLRLQLSKCDGSALSDSGYLWVLVNGQRQWRFDYTGGSTAQTFFINPVGEKAIRVKATYQLELYSNNDLNKAKLSGNIAAWPFYAATGQHYEYDISSTNWQCNSDDKIALRLNRSAHQMKVEVQKCDTDAKSFSQDGHFWILLDGRRQWGPFYYRSGVRALGPILVDPYGSKGVTGRHRYTIELHPNNQKPEDQLKYSGAAYATLDLLDPPTPPNQSPQIDFQTANGNAFPSGYLSSIEQSWSFQGTAADPDGQVNRVEFRCSGDQCGSVASHSGTTAWQHSQTGVQGRNEIYFRVYDDKDKAVSSRRLDLSVDLAAPTTTACLNGECNPTRWPTWFTQPVRVALHAVDGATGRARVDVQELRYRLDNGPWLTRRENPLTLYIESEGSHRLEYYALDLLGNQEAPRTITFQVDHTPPTPPAGVVETHGVVSEQWQKTQNRPTFTWNASSDAMSGLWGYQFYFGLDSQGIGYQAFQAADPRQWTPQAAGVGTGSWYLRGRSRDHAGNWSAWTTLFVYRYDGTPPDNPSEATHAVAEVQNDVWQRTVNSANFTWPVPNDEGSGVKGYYLYWGADPNGESNNLLTAAAYQSPTALCGSGQACTGYLRLRTIDNVDNRAEKWTTAYVLRYDNAPPVADFTINGGVTETNQTLVTLNLKATDVGSGVREMRLSLDGITWAPWEVYSAERLWSIPAIGRQDWPIYLQVRDGVGLESAVKQRTIYFDVNRRQPRSANFRLFDYTMSAGAGVHESATYKGRSTVGEIPEAARIQSINYQLVGGYEAGSQAIPLVNPGHDEFEHVNGVFASGVVAQTMRSTQYQMLGVLGESGLPNNATTLTSGNFAHQPGFLAAAPALITVPTATPTPGPTPTPEPEPACAFPLVSINGGAVFTGNVTVNLSICAPYATEMIVSNDGGFGGATWEPYRESRAWTITTHGQHVLPRFVYVAFKDKNGAIHSTYFDEIIYDPTPPAGEITIGDSVGAQYLVQSFATNGGVQGKAVNVGDVHYVTQLQNQPLAQPMALVGGNALNQIDLFVNARDANSGVAEIQLSLNSDFAGAAWEPYSALKRWTPTGADGAKTLYARFRDSAGNQSAQTTVSFVLDSQAPTGSLQLVPTIVGPDTLELTLNMSGIDNLSGVTEMRISTTPTFADSSWLPYTPTYRWPVYAADRSQAAAALYVQFRDQAGNVSQTATAGYQVDLTPPLLLAYAAAGDSLQRTVHVMVSDEQAGVEKLYISNDPLFIDGVQEFVPADTVTWTFTQSGIAWVQAKDKVGNFSQLIPIYTDAIPVVTPTETPTPIVTPTPAPGSTVTPIVTPTPPVAGDSSKLFLPLVNRVSVVQNAAMESIDQPMETPTPEPLSAPMVDNVAVLPSEEEEFIIQVFLPLISQ